MLSQLKRVFVPVKQGFLKAAGVDNVFASEEGCLLEKINLAESDT